MASVSRVDAIQAAVMVVLKKDAQDYRKRNVDPEGKPHSPTPEWLAKRVKVLLDAPALIAAFTDDLLAGL